ncbi:MAG TPA: hypothetical protein VMP86_07840 [Candidatus Binatia bacterium]|nr:hypothetical protein [Candidatus Binatia bacterium]
MTLGVLIVLGAWELDVALGLVVVALGGATHHVPLGIVIGPRPLGVTLGVGVLGALFVHDVTLH